MQGGEGLAVEVIYSATQLIVVSGDKVDFLQSRVWAMDNCAPQPSYLLGEVYGGSTP